MDNLEKTTKLPIKQGEIDDVAQTPMPRDPNSPISQQRTIGLTPANKGNLLPRVGDIFLGFNILEKLGEGGFGSVFLAEQVGLADRQVALKFTSRTNSEPERLASLQHTNIVPVYSVHTLPPIQVLCMPYLGRQTLQDVLTHILETKKTTKTFPLSGSAIVSATTMHKATSKGGRQQDSRRSQGSTLPGPDSVEQNEGPPSSRNRTVEKQTPTQPVKEKLSKLSFTDSVIWLFARLADALAHAHERGILHMDIKPSNILITDEGTPMVLDFGLAHDLNSGETGHAGGTLRYMAPEQMRGYMNPGAIYPDARMDLYALGVMFFEMLTGHHPFEESLSARATVGELIKPRLKSPPKVREFNSKVSPAIEAVVTKLLQPNPEHRYQTAQQLTTDLNLHSDNLPLKFAGNPSLMERFTKYRRRHPVLAMFMVACVLGMSTFGAAGAAAHQVRQRTQAEATIQAWNLHQSVAQLRIDLTTLDRGNDRSAALRKAEKWFDQYPVSTDTQWQETTHADRLTPGEREQLSRDLGELAMLCAHAERLNGINKGNKEDCLERALHWNRTAESCFAGLPLPNAVYAQRTELMKESGQDSVALPRTSDTTTPLTGLDFYFQGLSAMAYSKNELAVQNFLQLVERNPEHAAGQFNLGLVYQYQGRMNDASERYTLAKVLAPKDPRPAFNRGVLQLYSRKAKESLVEFNVAAERDPDFMATYYYRARAYQRLAQWKEALADANRAVAHDDWKYQGLQLRTELYDAMKDKTNAAKDREALAKLEPKTEADYLARGKSRVATDPKAAIADFTKSTELNPRYLTAWQYLANTYSEKLNEPQKALDAMDKMIALHPTSAMARTSRAVILARLGQRDEAHKIVKNVKLWADDSYVWYQSACVYAITSKTHPEDTNKALSHLRKALSEGYADFKHINDDTDLDLIRNEGGYRTALDAARLLHME